MNPIILIPARMASQRLSEKPLQLIHGDPMIVHVWRRAMESGIGHVVVACDDQQIADHIEKAGGIAVLTDPDLPSGSDRIWAALQHIDPENNYNVVINLQGDLPDLDPLLLHRVLDVLQQDDVDIGTLAVRFDNEADRLDPNQVKIVLSKKDNQDVGRALYFSRANVPYGSTDAYYHVGIYAYRRKALARYIQLPVSPLEKAEKLEQLRALEDGMKIGAIIVSSKPTGVDTPADLERAREKLKNQSKG